MPSTTAGTVFEDPPAQKPATVFDDVPDNLTVNLSQQPKPVSYNPLPQIWSDIKSIPSGIEQFLRHPVDATKAAVGEMNLQDPSKSSGLLGLPDVMYERYKAGQRGAAIAPLIEMGLPLAAEMPGAGTAGTAAMGALKGAGKTFVTPTTFGRVHFPLPAPIAGAMAGRYLGAPFGPAAEAAGSAVGFAAPIVRGAVQGAREALSPPPEVPFEPFEINPNIARQLNRRASGTGSVTGGSPRTSARRGINRAVQPELTPPPAAGGADQLLEDLAQSQTGRSFAKLPAEQQQAVRQLADRIQPSSQPQQPALPPPPKAEPAPQGRYGDLRQQHGGIYAANAEAKDLAVATYLRQKGITPEQWEKMDLNAQNAHIKATNPSYQPYKVEGSGGRRLGRPAAEGIADISTKLRNLWSK